jgi:hypothetical protein
MQRVPKTNISRHLSDELNDAASLLDLLLGAPRDKPGLDDERLVDPALAQLPL